MTPYLASYPPDAGRRGEFRSGQAMKRAITGFHRDDKGNWVARLECGHNQHVQHNPPWTLRPWVQTPLGRASRLGNTLDCLKCDRGEAEDPRPG